MVFFLSAVRLARDIRAGGRKIKPHARPVGATPPHPAMILLTTLAV
jgi:hypothetical protein